MQSKDEYPGLLIPNLRHRNKECAELSACCHQAVPEKEICETLSGGPGTVLENRRSLPRIRREDSLQTVEGTGLHHCVLLSTPASVYTTSVSPKYFLSTWTLNTRIGWPIISETNINKKTSSIRIHL